MRLVRAVLLTAALLTAATVTAVPSVADDQPTVSSIGSPADAGLEVRLGAPDALWVRVTVYASTASDAPVVFQSDDLTYDGSGGWHTDGPVHLADGTAPGDYPVDVDYRLQTGTVQHWSAAAHRAVSTFRYRLHTTVTSESFDRDTTDYDHRTVTLSGVASTYDPTTQTTGPARSGTSVRVSWTGDDPSKRHATTVRTGTAGRFRAAITPNGPVRSTSAQVVSPAADTAADPDMLAPNDVEVTRAQSRILGGPAHVRAHAGRTYTVSGTVQRLTASGWRAATGVTVAATTDTDDISYGTSHGIVGSGTTDASGHYAFRLTARRSVIVDTFVRSTYVYNGTVGETALSVPRAGSFARLAFSIDEFGVAHASGGLHGQCGQQSVVLQLSRNGHTGWTSIGSVRTGYQTAGQPCHFAVKGNGAVAGYYRVEHAESDYMLSVASRPARLSRILTRITGFSTSPQHPSMNGQLTATGRVTQHVGTSWRALGGAHVVLVFKLKGDTTWYRGATTVTDSAGAFRVSAKVYGDAAWAAYYAADGAHFYSQTGERDVDAY